MGVSLCQNFYPLPGKVLLVRNGDQNSNFDFFLYYRIIKSKGYPAATGYGITCRQSRGGEGVVYSAAKSTNDRVEQHTCFTAFGKLY